MKKDLWTIELVKERILKYFKEHAVYPTATDFDECDYLPSSRQMQRKFGGLVTLRTILKIPDQTDYTTGLHSTQRAQLINERSHKIEHEVFTYLVQNFSRESVHREYFFTDDNRVRLDFYIFCKKGNFAIDVFYPKSQKNMIGCINSKIRTYSNSGIIKFPLLFIVMNEEISEEVIAKYISNRKSPLPKHIEVLSFKQLKEYCVKMK